MVTRIITVAPISYSGSIVGVECDTSRSLPSLQIVGIGDQAIDEVKERVWTCLECNYKLVFRVSKKSELPSILLQPNY